MSDVRRVGGNDGMSHGAPAGFVVVLPTSNCAERRLRMTLESLASCVKPASFREVIVVENGPPSSARKVVEELESRLPLRYLYVARPNKSNALNRALEQIGNDFVFFTDDDVRVGENTLVAYANAASEATAGEFYGGPVLADWEEPPPSWLVPFLPRSATGWSLDTVAVAEPGRDYSLAPCQECLETIAFRRITFLGFNWAAFARDLLKLGGFNPARGPGSPTGATGQESDMQRRLIRSGVRPRYVRGAPVWHHVPRSRCSPEWALERAYRNGQGSAHAQIDTKTFLGVPPHWMGQLVGNVAEWAVARDRVSAFRVAHSWQMLRGFARERRTLASTKDPP